MEKSRGDEAEGSQFLRGPVGPGQAKSSGVRAVKPLLHSQHMGSDPELSVEASSLEGQVCLQTAPGYICNYFHVLTGLSLFVLELLITGIWWNHQ